MEVLFQSPDIGQTIRLQCSPETLVRDLGVSIAQALRLKSVPILYTYLNERASSELGRSTLVEGDRVVLPDDLRVGWVRDNLRDPSLPIYFENIDVSKSELFELRTLRFRQSGYDVDKLQAKTVLIGGVGLLGGEIAANVATVGVGELRVVDSGFVDWSNIYRQPLFSRDDVYKRKVDAVHDRLVEMGGTTVRTLQLQVPSWRHPLDEAQTRRHVASLDGLLAECSLAIGTFDSFSARAVLQYLCLSRRIPYLIAALEPGFGQVTLYTESKETGCYCCGMPDPRHGTWYDGGACTLSPLDGQRIVAALATKLVLDWLGDTATKNNAFTYIGRSTEIQPTRTSQNPRCSLCGPHGVADSSEVDIARTLIDWLLHQD